MSRAQYGKGYYAGIKAGIKSKISFYHYCIIMHDGENSVEGDFAYDIKRDKNFPKSINGRLQIIKGNSDSIETAPYRKDQYCKCIMDYLTYRHACKETKETFARLWQEWKQCMEVN